MSNLNIIIMYDSLFNFVYFSIAEYLCLNFTLIFSLCNSSYTAAIAI